MPEIKPAIETFAKIKVVGVGGSGNSALNRMIASKIKGVDFVAINTDVQALHHCTAPQKLHIGNQVTRGLGAGMNPAMGKAAADESQNELRDTFKGTDMVFITCGLGGGTGSGAGPEVAKIARESGALTVAVVTRPFGFEGAQRKAIADDAYDAMEENVDTIICIPNDRVLQIIDKKTSLLDSFKIVDDVLRQGVQGISELITTPGLINVDFADVKAIMHDTGSALMGIGSASGETRAVDAAKAAIASPLLEVSIDGARGVLFTISGGADLSMQEVNEAARIITESTDEDARIIFGANIDENLKDEVHITVVATGFGDRRPKRRESATVERNNVFGMNQNLFGPSAGSQPSYTPPTPVRQEQQEETATPSFQSKTFGGKTPAQDDDSPPPKKKKFLQSKKKRQIAPDVDIEVEPEEELEIPAFIRRKMGS